VERIVEEAYRTLEEVGVRVEHDAVREMLSGAGARVTDTGRVLIPRELCARSVESAPERFLVYDRDGEHPRTVGDWHVHFNPGSAATLLHDGGNGEIRKPLTSDVVDFVVITDRLDHYAFQSTGLVPDDVPAPISDRYRLFVALAFGSKPVVTGTFLAEGFEPMHAMLSFVRGGESALRDKPLAIFDCCPTSPLLWGEVATDALVRCARTGIPAQIVPAPLIGATAPVTLAGALVQHTAECLSGVVIHQLAACGAPVVYGGAATGFDMRAGTAPMASVEAMLVDIAHVQIGRTFGVPVHAYLALSDAKTPDFQAGMETAAGAVLAATVGVNVVSGPGILDYVNCQSLEKLVLDDEACAVALRVTRGVECRPGPLGIDVIAECADGKGYLTSEHTRKHFREEWMRPSAVVDRTPREDWEHNGRPDAVRRANDRVTELLAGPREPSLAPAALATLEEVIREDAMRRGVSAPPDIRRPR